MGAIGAILDRNRRSLIRGYEANPFFIDFRFSSPVTLRKLESLCGNRQHRLKVALYAAGADSAVRTFNAESVEYKEHGVASIDFEQQEVSRMRVELLDLEYPLGQPVKMHLYELRIE
jgi:hypothetical protein